MHAQDKQYPIPVTFNNQNVVIENTPIPIIEHIIPEKAIPGATIIIVGKNFDSLAQNNVVDFGNVWGKVLHSSTHHPYYSSSLRDTLQVQVPFGAKQGPIFVQSNHRVSTSPKSFYPISSDRWDDDTVLFHDVQKVHLGKYPTGIALSDLNNDGNQEIIVSYRSYPKISIFKYQSHNEENTINNIEEWQSVTLPFRCVGVRVSAIDCDGLPDIITYHHWYNGNRSENYLTVFKNLGMSGDSDAISFSIPYLFEVPPITSCLIIRDMDVDGKPDIIAVSRMKRIVSILRNTTGNDSAIVSFEPHFDIQYTELFENIEVGDLNGDQKPEIIIPFYEGKNIEVLENKSTPGLINDASFIHGTTFNVDGKPTTVAIADNNNDGLADVIIGIEESQSLLFFQKLPGGKLEFKPVGKTILPGIPVHPLFFYDINSDGKLDIVCLTALIHNNSQRTSQLVILKCITNSDSLGYKIVEKTPERLGRASIELGDMDNDTKMDVVSVERENRALTLHCHLEPMRINWLFYGVIAFSVLFVLVIGGWLINAFRWRKNDKVHTEFSKQLLERQELERKRISAELHDSVAQSILAIKSLAYFGKEAVKSNTDPDSIFDKISSISVTTIEELRNIMQNLRPVYLDRLGLTEAIQIVASQITESAKLSLTIEVDPIDNLLRPEDEINMFRIIQETLSNIVKHAQATQISLIGIRIGNNYFIEIKDNGIGFDLEETKRKNPKEGFGISGLYERAKVLQGKVELKSVAGKGTSIKITVPLQERT